MQRHADHALSRAEIEDRRRVRRERWQAWRDANRDRYNAYMRAWRKAHPARRRANDRRYAKRHRAAVAERRRAWYGAHRDEQLRRAHDRWLATPEARREARRAARRRDRGRPTPLTLLRLEVVLDEFFAGASWPLRDPRYPARDVGLPSRCHRCGGIIHPEDWCGKFIAWHGRWYALNVHDRCRRVEGRAYYRAHRERRLATANAWHARQRDLLRLSYALGVTLEEIRRTGVSAEDMRRAGLADPPQLDEGVRKIATFGAPPPQSS